MKKCVFCSSENTEVITVANADGNRSWRYCHRCGASGPQKSTPEEADVAYVVAPAPAARKTGVRRFFNRESS